MKSLLANIKIRVDERVYLKDPEGSEKGRSIVEQRILLIDELGLESFTFKKLAERIGPTEVTIYRHFATDQSTLLVRTRGLSPALPTSFSLFFSDLTPVTDRPGRLFCDATAGLHYATDRRPSRSLPQDVPWLFAAKRPLLIGHL